MENRFGFTGFSGNMTMGCEMQKRYHNTTNLILIGCMAVAAFTGCSGKTDEKQTQADTGSKREKMIAKLV